MNSYGVWPTVGDRRAVGGQRDRLHAEVVGGDHDRVDRLAVGDDGRADRVDDRARRQGVERRRRARSAARARRPAACRRRPGRSSSASPSPTSCRRPARSPAPLLVSETSEEPATENARTAGFDGSGPSSASVSVNGPESSLPEIVPALPVRVRDRAGDARADDVAVGRDAGAGGRGRGAVGAAGVVEEDAAGAQHALLERDLAADAGLGALQRVGHDQPVAVGAGGRDRRRCTLLAIRPEVLKNATRGLGGDAAGLDRHAGDVDEVLVVVGRAERLARDRDDVAAAVAQVRRGAGERRAERGAGLIVTLLAPAPLSVSGLVIVRPFFEPAWLGELLPARRGRLLQVACPAQMTTVSHGAAWSTAAWIEVKRAFGQSALSSSTVQVDAKAVDGAIAAITAAATTARSGFM